VRVAYAYARQEPVSFKIMAEKHIEYLSKLGVVVEPLDENMFVNSEFTRDRLVVTHPHAVLMLLRLAKHLLVGSARSISSARGDGRFLGFDVCEADRLTDLDVEVVNTADTLAVPSKFCLEAYRRSGVKPRVEVVPHGVDPWWYELPKQTPSDPSVKLIEKLKVDKGYRVLLFFYWNDIPLRALRKGWDEVKEFHSKLQSERRDVLLVVKSSQPVGDLPRENAVNTAKWLDVRDLIALYDLADIVLLFSRAGGFELNALEALGRGVPVIAHNYGSWTEYTPSFLLVPWRHRIPSFSIDIGQGDYWYIIDVDKAVDKAHEILENYGDYKARVLEWRDKVLREIYVWDKIAVKIKQLIGELVQSTQR
jgi:glycosyltransferase involved in cell wall biosynthesis